MQSILLQDTCEGELILVVKIGIVKHFRGSLVDISQNGGIT
jgi:hypothetical protein